MTAPKPKAVFDDPDARWAFLTSGADASFANATGGLLVVGIASTGEVRGLKHLMEDQINALRIEELVHHNCQVRLHDARNAAGEADRIALFWVPPCPDAICDTNSMKLADSAAPRRSR